MDILYFYIGIIAYVHYEEEKDLRYSDKFNQFVFIVLCTVFWPVCIAIEFYKLCKGKEGIDK